MLRNKLLFNSERNIYEEIERFLASGSDAVYIWGTGSVALGAAKACLKRNLPVKGYFTDADNREADPRLPERPVYTFSELCAKEKSFSVIVGHSHYELVSRMEDNEQIINIWMLPVVARPDINLSKAFILDNIDALEHTYSSLEDELSRQNMVDFLNVHLTNDPRHIIKHFDKPCDYFNNDIIMLNNDESYLDAGAYIGDSVISFIRACKGSYDNIIAVEVLPEIYSKLEKMLSPYPRTQAVCAGLSDHNGTDYFDVNEQSTCLAGGVL